MSKVKRFFFVASKRSRTVHRAVSRSEGLTYCGRHVTTAWHWWRPPLLRRFKLPKCSRCERA